MRAAATLHTARATAAVLACWNCMIPYLCPEMPARQRDALHSLVKTPLVYTTVALRNWRAFKALGVAEVYAPGSYHNDSVHLNSVVDIGGYTSVRSPDEPILVRMTRVPCSPGLDPRSQFRAGQAELLATSFETFERNIRDQLHAHPRSGRVRSGGRHRRHHGQSLAARLRLRIQSIVRSGLGRARPAPRRRPRALRPNRDREFGFRRRAPIPTWRSTRLGAPLAKRSRSPAEASARCPEAPAAAF